MQLDKKELPGSEREEELESVSVHEEEKKPVLPEPVEETDRRGDAGEKKRFRLPRKETPAQDDPELPEETSGEAPRRPVNRRLIGRLVLVGAALLLALFIGLMFLFPELFNLDRFVRFFRYMGLRNKAGYGVINYETGADNVYYAFDGCLAVGSESGLTLYDLEGKQKAMVQGTLSDPLVSCGDKICAIYSPGTSYLAAFGKGGKILLDQTVTGTILDLDVSNDGYLCYLGSESGYKSTATLYSPKQELQFRLTSRTRYLNACAVSDGGKYLAVASLGEEESVFCSEITILRTRDRLDDLDSEDSTAVRVNLGSQVIYDLEFLSGGTLCAIGQNDVTFLSPEGKIYRQISLEKNPLVGYDFSSKGFVVLLQRIGMAGENYRLTTLDGSGEELGLLDLEEKVRDVSACGRYVAVLKEGKAVIYRRNLKKYASTSEVGTATRIVARPDGTALLVSGTQAVLYIP